MAESKHTRTTDRGKWSLCALSIPAGAGEQAFLGSGLELLDANTG